MPKNPVYLLFKNYQKTALVTILFHLIRSRAEIMKSIPISLSNNNSPSFFPSKTGVDDDTVNYTLRNIEHFTKQGIINSSPSSVINVSQETQANHNNTTMFHVTNQSYEEENDLWWFYNLPECSSASIMRDIIRSIFTSQVSSEHLNTKAPIDNTVCSHRKDDS